VKIGNWNEDIARTEVAAQDYEVRRAKGDLVHITKAREKSFLSQSVPLSFSEDGSIRFGFTVMLATGESGSPYYLGNLFNNFLTPGHVRVTATMESSPQARNTFVLSRAPGAPRAKGVPEDDLLRYGDCITLACNPSLVADLRTHVAGLPYYLRSSRGSNVLGTSRKGKQEVSMCRTLDSDCRWILQPSNGDRLLCEGEVVTVGSPVSLLHAMSNVMLCGNPGETYPSEFGRELDVHCATHKGTGQVSASHGGVLPVIHAQPANIWTFSLASHPSQAEDRRNISPMTSATVMRNVREALGLAGGLHALRSLFLSFEALDPKGTGYIPSDGFKWTLYEHGAKCEEAEFSLLIAPFLTRAGGGRGVTITRAPPPHSQSSMLDRLSLVDALRGGVVPALSSAASRSVSEAYLYLCSSLEASPHSGLAIGPLKHAFDGKLDPRVVAGKMTRAEAKGEFARQWPRHLSPGATVSLSDFTEYYSDVCGVTGEDPLNDLLANTWHIPGQGSWLTKKGKRVQVTFHKGSSTEAVIKEGEGIPDEDQAQLMYHLEKMGYGGIARVKVLGLVDPPADE